MKITFYVYDFYLTLFLRVVCLLARMSFYRSIYAPLTDRLPK